MLITIWALRVNTSIISIAHFWKQLQNLRKRRFSAKEVNGSRLFPLLACLVHPQRLVLHPDPVTCYVNVVSLKGRPFVVHRRLCLNSLFLNVL